MWLGNPCTEITCRIKSHSLWLGCTRHCKSNQKGLVSEKTSTPTPTTSSTSTAQTSTSVDNACIFKPESGNSKYNQIIRVTFQKKYCQKLNVWKCILVSHCSAHSVVSLELKAKGMKRITLCCKFNNSFLEYRNYINIIRQAILDLKKKTALPSIKFW